MSDIRVPKRVPRTPSSAEHRPGARESKRSLYWALWALAAPFVGFVLAETIFNLRAQWDWELWKAVVLGTLMMAPFAVGAYFGLRSVLSGFRGGWIGLIANLALAAVAIGMPISEAMAG